MSGHRVPLVPGIRPYFSCRRRGVALGCDLPAIPSPLLRPLHVRLTISRTDADKLTAIGGCGLALLENDLPVQVPTRGVPGGWRDRWDDVEDHAQLRAQATAAERRRRA